MATDYLLQEDGASKIILESGAGDLILESSGAPSPVVFRKEFSEYGARVGTRQVVGNLS